MSYNFYKCIQIHTVYLCLRMIYIPDGSRPNTRIPDTCICETMRQAHLWVIHANILPCEIRDIHIFKILN